MHNNDGDGGPVGGDSLQIGGGGDAYQLWQPGEDHPPGGVVVVVRSESLTLMIVALSISTGASGTLVSLRGTAAILSSVVKKRSLFPARCRLVNVVEVRKSTWPLIEFLVE